VGLVAIGIDSRVRVALKLIINDNFVEFIGLAIGATDIAPARWMRVRV
jgi:hypothetical protein